MAKRYFGGHTEAIVKAIAANSPSHKSWDFIEKTLLISLTSPAGRALATAIRRMRFGEHDINSLMAGYDESIDPTTRATVFEILSAAISRQPLYRPIFRRLTSAKEGTNAAENTSTISSGETHFDGVLLQIGIDERDLAKQDKLQNLGIRYCVQYQPKEQVGGTAKEAVKTNNNNAKKDFEWHPYLRPLAITCPGKVTVWACTYKCSSGIDFGSKGISMSSAACLSFTVTDNVEPPQIILETEENDRDQRQKANEDNVPILHDAMEVKIKDSQPRTGSTPSEDSSLLFVIEKLSARSAGNQHTKDVEAHHIESTGRPYFTPVLVREPGIYRVVATTARRGPISRRWYTSVVSVKQVKLVRSVFKIPKAIIQGALSVSGTTVAYLRKNEGHFLSAFRRSLKYGSKKKNKDSNGNGNCDDETTCSQDENGVRCQVVEIVQSRTIQKGVDVHYAIELSDEVATTLANDLKETLRAPLFTTNLSTQLRLQGLQGSAARRATGVQICVKKNAELENLRYVNLDLCWDVAQNDDDGTEVDYLDGSCLLFAQETFVDVLDWKRTCKVHRRFSEKNYGCLTH